MKKLLLYILASFVIFYNTSAQSSVVVVVAKNSTIEALDLNQVANIFLARTNRFPNGEKSTPVEFVYGNSREEFYVNISGKNTKQLMAYWTTLIFTGKGRPPKGYKELEQLMDALPLKLNYITYLDSSLVTEDMKVVFRF